MTIDAKLGTAEPAASSTTEPGPVPLVKVDNVSHSFDSKEVLKGITLDLYPGEIVIMTGQSGSGKTTLLTLIGGLRTLQKNSGRIQVDGRDLAKMKAPEFREHRRKLGFIFQAHNLFGSLSALQNVRLAQELVGVEKGEARPSDKELNREAIVMLRRLQLKMKSKRQPHQLSGGERQRVSIARALINSPRLILADEPTAALDAERAPLVVELIKKIVKKVNGVAIIVTHDTKIVEVADRIVNLHCGKLVSNIDVRKASEICDFLQESKPLRAIIPGTLTVFDLAIANQMREESFQQGQVIFREGEPGDKFYMIKSGCVAGVRDPNGDREEFELEKGQFFGEIAVLNNQPRNATLTAKTDLQLFSLRKKEFEEILDTRATFAQQVRKAIDQRLSPETPGNP